jgi:pimeloyl-ACP methyl ester carboxylesterase
MPIRRDQPHLNVGHAGRTRPVAPADPVAVVAPVAPAAAAVVDTVGRPGRAAPLAQVTGPYAGLAARGDFSGYVKTKSGQELFVTLRVARENAGTERPMVYLDGLAARRSRADTMADSFRDVGGRTVLSILLPGQGETLLKDLEKTGGKSINHDIKDSDQAAAVIEALDALGIKGKVDIFGLSYGGAIATATARDHSDRIGSTVIVAPHTRSQARDDMGDMAWQMVNNPWNPMGASMYRSAAKSTLANAFAVPELFKKHPDAFPEALLRLSMGIDKNELDASSAGVDHFHVLVAEGDGASPLAYNKKAVDAAKSGSLTKAPNALKGQHDLVSASPEFVVSWVTSKLSPERQHDVDTRLKPLIDRRTTLQAGQALFANAAQQAIAAVKLPPAEMVGPTLDALSACYAAAKSAVDVAANNADPEVKAGLHAVAKQAVGLSVEVAKVFAALAKDAPSTEHEAAARKANAIVARGNTLLKTLP